MQFPIEEIWYPDFFISEADDKKYLSTASPVQVAFLSADGITYYTDINIVKGKCSLNLWNFPFDNQTCKLTYILKRIFNPNKKMDVNLEKSSMAYRFDSVSDDEWEIISTRTNVTILTGKEYNYRADGSLEDTPAIVQAGVATGFEVHLQLRRYSDYYVINIVTPLLVLAALDHLPFLMEDDESEKLVTAVSVVLGYMFLQGIVANLLPKSNTTPYLAGYIAASLSLSAASVFADGLCYSLCYREGEPGKLTQHVLLDGLGTVLYPSKWLALFYRWKAKRSKIRANSETESRSVNFNGSATESCSAINKEKPKWRDVAHVLNRLFALVHLLGALIYIVLLFMPICLPLV